jgi:molecular chaperone GrpE
VKKRPKYEEESRDNDDNKGEQEVEAILPTEATSEEVPSSLASEAIGEEVRDEVIEGEPTALTSDEEIENLRLELEEARKQAEENLDGWQRARAEFANYKKRIEREKETERARIAGEILVQYLNILDDFELALKDLPQNQEIESWYQGMDLIYHKLKTILETEGIEPIRAEGEMFDPNFHEAIMQEESDDHEEGQILEVVRQGYKIGDRVLRPAVVRVAK